MKRRRSARGGVVTLLLLAAALLLAAPVFGRDGAGTTPTASGASGAVRRIRTDTLRAPLRQAVSEEDLRAGRALYESSCASCHGDAGGGTDLGPAIVGLGPAAYDFMLSTGRMPLDRPVRQAPRKEPAFTRPQMDQLIAYLALLPPGGGVSIPAVDPAVGDLGLGQRLYQLNCAACHGTTGIGGAVGAVTAPSLFVATPVQVGEAVRTGPGAMPDFDPETISDPELNSVARYVLYLRRPDDRGGAGLGHVGPIVEGFVALLAGLGAIVMVTRLIGERSRPREER